MSNSVRPHRTQPTRLPCPWDSPGKNTGVGCHFLLQCMKVKRESEVAPSRLTLATPWTSAYQAPLSMGFSRQEYWSGVPLPSPVHEREKWEWSCSVMPTLSDPMDFSLPGSSVHGICQAKILEWVAISFSRESSWPRDWTHVSCIGRWILYHWATWETCCSVYRSGNTMSYAWNLYNVKTNVTAMK